jgi:hypothetical protein
MDIDGLITENEPPANRVGKHTGTHERHFSEAAVMLAFVAFLMRTEQVGSITLCPDGEHAKRFDITGWLAGRGYRLVEPRGKTAYGGSYLGNDGSCITVSPTSGVGDVVAVLKDGQTIIAECKGGVINTSHPGQKSRLRKGLCEVIGLLMAKTQSGRQIAVVPQTDVTERLALSMKPRCNLAGIEIALINDVGEVAFV